MKPARAAAAPTGSPLAWWEAASPIGPLLLLARGAEYVGIHFQSGPGPRLPPGGAQQRRAPFEILLCQLDEYFAGQRRVFELPLAPAGTGFQCDVWAAMRGIPFGATRSYGEIARQISRPKAVRAVGQACGANPLPIVIPCHRVLASGAQLGGFGGGLAIKRALLALESGGRS